MQEFNWIEKINEENKTGEIFIEIKNYRNIRKKLSFKFIRNGLTIIVGKNNVGKTNILNYIYERGSEWNGFSNEAYKKDEKGDPLYKHLPFFFGNDKRILSPQHKKIRESRQTSGGGGWVVDNTNIVAEKLNFKYFYKLYYLDLKTFFDFLGEKTEEDRTPKKIKIGGCELYYIENYNEKVIKEIGSKTFLWGREEKRESENWKINYSGKVASIRATDFEKEGKITTEYKGYNEGTEETHEIDGVGSGYLKNEKIKTLIKKISSGSSFSNEFYRSILLIDELEVLFHPSLINEISDLIKSLKQIDITTVLTTHSPSLLSKFVYENEENTEIVIAKSEKKEGKEDLLGEIIHFWDIVKEIKEEIEKVWKSYCECLRYQDKDEDELYISYWRSLLNEHTLKIFFSEEILFVEGMSDYILLTSEFLKNQIPELRKIEVIPIFGKSNYIFFSKLTEKLHSKFWFLLDMDKNEINENKFSNKPYYNKENISFSENREENKDCDSLELHTQFWYKHRGSLKNLTEIKEDEIANSGEESRISWFPENMENFLLKEGSKDKFWEGKGRHKWARKEARIVGSISSEEFIEERFENLKKELRKIIRSIKEQIYKEENVLLKIKKLK